MSTKNEIGKTNLEMILAKLESIALTLKTGDVALAEFGIDCLVQELKTQIESGKQ